MSHLKIAKEFLKDWALQNLMACLHDYKNVFLHLANQLYRHDKTL